MDLLSENREKISALDDELAKIFLDRRELALEISEWKRANALPLEDKTREHDEIARLLDTFFADADQKTRNAFILWMQQLFGVSKAIMRDKCEDELPLETIIYTDGACKGNPGPGGYGIVIYRNGERTEYSGGYGRTTNNRMELLAAIIALEQTSEGESICLYSDSQYLIKAFSEGWLENWKKKNWKRQGDVVKNKDLWMRLDALCSTRTVRFEWVKGHAETVENNICDQLAVKAAEDISNYIAEEFLEHEEEAL